MDLRQLGGSIAEGSRYDSMARRFRPGGAAHDISEVAVWLLLVAGIILVVWFSHKVAGSLIQSRNRSIPKLFRELCAAHGVTWFQRRLLHELARAHGLPHPVHLYLRPSCFEPQHVPANLAAYRSQIAALRERLFGSSAWGEGPGS